MKKTILNLGKALNKETQKEISGGCYGCIPGGGLGPGLGGGGSSGGGGSTGGGSTGCAIITSCRPGKCFNLQSCRCSNGYPNQDGTCV